MADFLAWQRPAVHALATEAPTGARLDASLPITLHDDIGGVAATASFLLAGPGDVERLHARQVVGRRPHPGCIDAETTMMPFVELDAADLPWRFSPVLYAAGMLAVRPWMVLVVGTPDEVQRLTGGRVTLSGAELFGTHLLTQSFLWAHVHVTPGRTFSRIVSPRELALDRDYVAALVPSWQAQFNVDGTSTLTDSWSAAQASVTLPCFDSWTFRTTAEPGDFASISQLLEPLSDADSAMLRAQQFGRAKVGVGPLRGTTLAAGGALTVIPEPSDPPVTDPLPADVRDTVTALTANLEVGGRWVLTLPRYDAPWYPGPVDGQPWTWPAPTDEVTPPGWRTQLRTDPRHRGAAGIGAWTAISWQNKIADGAARQAGAVAAAGQRIRHLVLGLRGSASLWNRRVPTDSIARLATLSPLLGRMPVGIGGSALQAIGGRTPTLAPALFSSAARRMLRRRGPLDRASAPGATSLATLISTANRCPDPQKLSGDDAKVTDLASTEAEKLAGQLNQRSRTVLTAFYSADHPDLAQAEQIAESIDVTGLPGVLVGIAGQRPPATDCRPLPDLSAFANSIAAGVDPTVGRPVVVDRVLGGLTGLREPVLAEPDIAPEIDIPLWSFLKDNAPDWLLPGAGDIPADRVLAVQSNPAFTEALLLGANHQTLGELRWRNIPITARWTPLRRFWQRIDVQGGQASVDIRPVVALDTDLPLWPDGTELGDVSHLSDPDQGASLVVVFHTELFRRYPTTAVYLTPNPDGERWLDVPNVDQSPLDRKYPSFSGSLNPDLVFFGFDVAPSAGSDHWVVLEEPPPGYRFLRPGADGSPTAAGITDAATFASKTFFPPTRVFLGNLL